MPLLQPNTIHHLLLCPICYRQTISPITLYCGHSICLSHINQQHQQRQYACPVDACNKQESSRPRIPPTSRVQYTPAPSYTHPQAIVNTNHPDVALSNVLALTARTAARLDQPFLDSDPGTDDDDNNNNKNIDPRHLLTSRPRKRHKRNHDTPIPSEEGLLDHLRAVAAHERTVPPNVPIIPDNPNRDSILEEFSTKLFEELTCHICYSLLYQPITTPCQHTFCTKCLHRSLDHSNHCPICRHNLPDFSYFQNQPVNQALSSIIQVAFPDKYNQRHQMMSEEERNARLNTPIFVSHLCFPGLPAALHLFEPRYRLMLRRCLESSNPRFGMVMRSRNGSGISAYGTMLDIHQVQMLPDGRSLVTLWGSRRFRVLEWGTMDGYHVARVEMIDDYADDLAETHLVDEILFANEEDEHLSEPLDSLSDSDPRENHNSDPGPQGGDSTPSSTSTEVPSTDAADSAASSEPAQAPTLESRSDAPALDPLQDQGQGQQTPPPRTHANQPTNEELMAMCRAFVERLQRGAAPWVVQRYAENLPPMPTDPDSFSFWIAHLLPIDDQEKAKLLPIRSARLRLLVVTHWIKQLGNNWYGISAFNLHYNVLWSVWWSWMSVVGWAVWAAECVITLAFRLLFLLFGGNLLRRRDRETSLRDQQLSSPGEGAEEDTSEGVQTTTRTMSTQRIPSPSAKLVLSLLWTLLVLIVFRSIGWI